VCDIHTHQLHIYDGDVLIKEPANCGAFGLFAVTNLLHVNTFGVYVGFFFYFRSLKTQFIPEFADEVVSVVAE